METGAGPGQRLPDDRVQAKLITAAMNAELQVRRQTVAFNRVSDHSEIILEFLFELGQVTDVIHSLVEPASKLRRDRLHPNVLVRECCQDDKQLRRCLRLVGFIHRNLGDETVFPFIGSNMVINLPGFLGRQQIFRGDPLDFRSR